MERVPVFMKGRVVLVSGGTKGIGRAIAQAFLGAGADVLVCARKPPEQPIGAGERAAEFVACDVREPAQIDAVVAAARARWGRIDVLVNNAGGSPPANAATASPRFSTAIITLNLIAPLHFAQRANAVMQEQADGGMILNIASVAGLRAAPGVAAYGAAKAGLLSLTQSLAMEWAPKVRVNAIAPGAVRTEAFDSDFAGYGGSADALAATVPLGRLCVPDDVAGACLLLASPWAQFVSGACLLLHGGGEKVVATTPPSSST
jgi:NAD(P)-dependent dehydrogenase (short-subunit alcohol dehydrogenase family)